MNTGVKRQDHEAPDAISNFGWRFHHLGIPSDIPRAGEKYIAEFRMYVSGFETSPYGVEWMRFEPGSPISELIKTVPHLAFEVDDIDSAVEGKEILTKPTSFFEGIRVAMIIHNGAPIELLEFRKHRS
jgi:hypothetical protein